MIIIINLVILASGSLGLWTQSPDDHGVDPMFIANQMAPTVELVTAIGEMKK